MKHPNSKRPTSREHPNKMMKTTMFDESGILNHQKSRTILGNWNPTESDLIQPDMNVSGGSGKRWFRINLLLAGGAIMLSDLIAGWSSPVARQAHNLKVVGSN